MKGWGTTASGGGDPDFEDAAAAEECGAAEGGDSEAEDAAAAPEGGAAKDGDSEAEDAAGTKEDFGCFVKFLEEEDFSPEVEFDETEPEEDCGAFLDDPFLGGIEK